MHSLNHNAKQYKFRFFNKAFNKLKNLLNALLKNLINLSFYVCLYILYFMYLSLVLLFKFGQCNTVITLSCSNT